MHAPVPGLLDKSKGQKATQRQSGSTTTSGLDELCYRNGHLPRVADLPVASVCLATLRSRWHAAPPQSSTVSVGEQITGNANPQLDAAGTDTDSPITQWKAIRTWSGQCGGFLLKRDLDPASNDNLPAFVNYAA
jgi:hypothetical protein